MESLQLPMDLYWDGKMEPESPSSELFSLSTTEESWCFEDDFAKSKYYTRYRKQWSEMNWTMFFWNFSDILFSNVDVDEKVPLDKLNSEDILFEFEYDVKNGKLGVFF